MTNAEKKLQALSTDYSTLIARQNVPNSTDQSTGALNRADHDAKTKKELALKQPPMKDYVLRVAQEPLIVEASEHEPGVTSKKSNAKSNRKRSAHAIEPMPIVELVHGSEGTTNSSINVNPQMFLYADILPANESTDLKDFRNQLLGDHAASIFRCKRDKLPQENGYFIFQDLRVKFPGKFRIGFTLFEIVEVPMQTMVEGQLLNTVSTAALPCAFVASQVFEVVKKGTSLPDPQNSTPIVHYIEAGGAKLRYRKAQTKRVKTENSWNSTMNNISSGPVFQKSRKPSGKHMGIEGDLTESAPAPPTFPSIQTIPQPDPFPAAGMYSGMHVTSPAAYTADEVNVTGNSNFAVPQSSFTFSHPVTQPALTSAYQNAYTYPAPQFGNCMQLPQPMNGYPMIQNMQNTQNMQNMQDMQNTQNTQNMQSMQNEQSMQPPFQYQASTNYHGQQMQDQQRMPDRGHYQQVSQYSAPNEVMYNAAGQSTGFVNAEYEQTYHAQDEQDLRSQHGQYHSQQGFFPD